MLEQPLSAGRVDDVDRRVALSIFSVAGALTAAGNRVFVLIEARSSYLLFWEDRLREVAERVIIVTRRTRSRSCPTRY